jgi:hypothetical protein
MVMYGEQLALTRSNLKAATILRWVAALGIVAFCFFRFDFDRALATSLLIAFVSVMADHLRWALIRLFGAAERQRWHGELTLRFALEELAQQWRGDGRREMLDVGQIFDEAQKRAWDDINLVDRRYEADKEFSVGGFLIAHSPTKSLILHVLEILVTYTLAGAVGTFLRGA